MSTTIQLITPEALTAQWKQLDAAMIQTEAMMKAMGVPIPLRAGILEPPPKQAQGEVAPKPANTAKPPGLRGAVSDAVRAYYPQSDGKPFGIVEIRAFLDSNYPGNEFSRTSISAALSYDATCGRLKIITQGGR